MSTDALDAQRVRMPPVRIPLARPHSGSPDETADRIRSILTGSTWTNGEAVLELEERVADHLGVRHYIAVSSCTVGLMLVLRAAGIDGEVIIPSFTFAATAHAVAWNGARPVFVDVDPFTLTLDPVQVAAATSTRTTAILATHLYGTPCDVEVLAAEADAHGISLFFDAAHAFGSVHRGRRIGGFGRAEVFSLSPTKPLVAAEGGLITTDDDGLAARCRIGRDYANPGDYDCRFVGLNGRMSELHAAVGLASLVDVEERLVERRRIAAVYRRHLAAVPGISYPRLREGDVTTLKDLTILVDAERFGLDAKELAHALATDGIETRRYYDPPVHLMAAYRRSGATPRLPVTERVAHQVVSLPLWHGMSDDLVAQVAHAVATAPSRAEREVVR